MPANMAIAEPTPADEVFVDGIASIECKTDYVCVTFYRDRAVFYGAEESTNERHVVLRLICGASGLKRMGRQMAEADGDKRLGIAIIPE